MRDFDLFFFASFFLIASKKNRAWRRSLAKKRSFLFTQMATLKIQTQQ